MNLNLPMYFYDEFLFAQSNKVQILAFLCFFLAFLLIVYSVVVLDKDRKIQVKNQKKKVLDGIDDSLDEDIGGEVYQDALRVLDKARTDSLKILSKAQIKAQGLLDNTYTISQENRKKLEQNLTNIYEKQGRSLQNLSEELLESYKNAVEEGKQENIRTLYEASEVMKKEALSGVNELKDVIKKETLGAQEALESKLREEYAKIDKEIKDYKDGKLKSLNKKILDLLSDIYSNVIKQDLDQNKHEKLILSMLDEEVSKLGLIHDIKPKDTSDSALESET